VVLLWVLLCMLVLLDRHLCPAVWVRPT